MKQFLIDRWHIIVGFVLFFGGIIGLMLTIR
jgi:nitrogen fixation protein FixH